MYVYQFWSGKIEIGLIYYLMFLWPHCLVTFELFLHSVDWMRRQLTMVTEKKQPDNYVFTGSIVRKVTTMSLKRPKRCYRTVSTQTMENESEKPYTPFCIPQGVSTFNGTAQHMIFCTIFFILKGYIHYRNSSTFIISYRFWNR